MKMKLLYAATLLVLILIILAFVVAIPLLAVDTMPYCSEDEAIMGIGEFENGRWSAYVCGPALDNCK